MNLWLSDAEIADATRRRQPAAQARVLDDWKVPYRRRPDGTLQVGRAAMEAAFAPAENPVEPVPTVPARRYEGSPLQRYHDDTGQVVHWEPDAATRNDIAAQHRRDVELRKAANVRWHEAKRRAAQLQRTPPWADLAAIRRLYELAQRKTRDTGVAHHVDHAIPLQGRLVCGLHVENNLQILTGAENSRKRNRFEPA